MFINKLIRKILILCVGFLPLISFAQLNVIGRVSDIDSGEPLPGATILLDDGKASTISDSEGIYSLMNLKNGVHSIRFLL